MSEGQHARRIGRSIGAVLADSFGVITLSLGTDTVLHTTCVFPPWGQPMSGALLLLAAVYGRDHWGAVTTRNRGPEVGPRWYPAVPIVVATPTVRSLR